MEAGEGDRAEDSAVRPLTAALIAPYILADVISSSFSGPLLIYCFLGIYKGDNQVKCTAAVNEPPNLSGLTQ